MNASASGMVMRADRWRAWVAAGLCLAAAVPVVRVVWQEGEAARLVTAASGAPDLRGEVLERFADTAPTSLNDRANAAMAQGALVEAANAQQDSLKAFYLARADTAIAHLRQTRPDWAPTRLLAVQAHWGRYGKIAPEAVADYAASYRAAPFLRGSAQWRIAYGAAAWDQLPPDARRAMIDEALWLVRYDGAMRPVVRDLLGDSPAGMQFAMHLKS